MDKLCSSWIQMYLLIVAWHSSCSHSDTFEDFWYYCRMCLLRYSRVILSHTILQYYLSSWHLSSIWSVAQEVMWCLKLILEINRSEQILYFWIVTIYIHTQADISLFFITINLRKYNVQESTGCLKQQNMSMDGLANKNFESWIFNLAYFIRLLLPLFRTIRLLFGVIINIKLLHVLLKEQAR
jgi:hypothetical protein